ncbi:MAG: glycoside hydrolase family 20 zincin-like fold domain-containing protein, partial [Armatimonadota bacterium]
MKDLQGIPGYPQGVAEPLHGYREELRSPLHSRRVAREGAVAPLGAAIITPDWRVLLPSGTGEQLATAAADFARFLEVCMGTHVHVEECDEDASAEKVVALWLAPHQLPVPESYVLDVTPERVLIRGADASGLQYALYELEERMASAGGPYLAPGAVLRQPWLR